MFRHLVESLVIPDHENQICEAAVAAHARTEFEQRPEAFEPAIRHFRNHLSRAAFDDACGDIEVKIGISTLSIFRGHPISPESDGK